MKQNIVLVGLMGTGKTAVSRILSERLGWKRIDTDEMIVEHEQQTIPDIFAAHGEPYFRQVEERMVELAMQGSEQIVSTGGGAVLSSANRRRMLERGLVVALSASADTIVERVKHDRGRPLLLGDLRERVLNIMEERKTAYDFADFRIDTDARTIDEIVDLIVSRWEKL